MLQVHSLSLQSTFSRTLDISNFYSQLYRIGLQYGPAFQTVREIWVADDRQSTLARISLGEDQQLHVDKYKIHPALLDGLLPDAHGDDRYQIFNLSAYSHRRSASLCELAAQ